MGEESAGRIFISYRRVDTPHVAGRLFDRLEARFGTGNVFMDVDSIEPGLDFVETIEQAVGACDVLLALIGPHWEDALDEHGRRRLEDPDDFVTLEITAALRRRILVIPVLVDGAPPPRPGDLPEALATLARRQGLRLEHTSFGAGMATLMTALERALRTRMAGREDQPQPEMSEPASGHNRRRDSGENPLVRSTAHRDAPPPRPTLPNRATTTAQPPPAPWRLAGTPTELIRMTHDDVVSEVVFSPDGTRLATTSGKSARVWDPTTGQQLTRMTHRGRLFSQEVTAVVFSPDGTRLATTSGTSARVWDPTTGQQLTRITHDRGKIIVYGVAFSPDGTRLATASYDKTARIWDLTTGRELTRMTHDGLLWRVAFSPDGSRLATASNGTTAWVGESTTGQARIWDPTTGQELTRITHDERVGGVAFSPDGARLATASNDGTARVWDLTTGRELTRITHDRNVLGVAFSPDGTRLATASSDYTARVWALSVP